MKIRLPTNWVLAGLFCVHTSWLFQPANSQTLAEALASAYSTNPGLLAQRADL